MAIDTDITAKVRAAADQRILFLPHALRQMLRPERMIRREEVVTVIAEGTVIEDYPEDSRGHSCLMLGLGSQGRPIHIVCATKEYFLAVITAYLPDENEWTDNFSRRREK